VEFGVTPVISGRGEVISWNNMETFPYFKLIIMPNKFTVKIKPQNLETNTLKIWLKKRPMGYACNLPAS
jgi:hypothetical protein